MIVHQKDKFRLDYTDFTLSWVSGGSIRYSPAKGDPLRRQSQAGEITEREYWRGRATALCHDADDPTYAFMRVGSGSSTSSGVLQIQGFGVRGGLNQPPTLVIAGDLSLSGRDRVVVST